MNKDLILIIESIQSKTRNITNKPNELDNVCDEIMSLDNGCDECDSETECGNCLLGYKDQQYYPNIIIRIWRSL